MTLALGTIFTFNGLPHLSTTAHTFLKRNAILAKGVGSS